MRLHPTRPYRALRATVATAIIAVVVGLWAWGQATGQPVDTVWTVVVLALVVASGYAVFGPRTMGQAIDDARDLADGGGGGAGDDADDGGGSDGVDTDDSQEGDGG